MENQKKKTKPQHEPTERLRGEVTAYARAGYSHVRIGELVGIDAKTLRKHYRTELDFSKDKFIAKIHAVYAQQALKGDGKACRWFLENQGGFRGELEEENKPSTTIILTRGADVKSKRKDVDDEQE